MKDKETETGKELTTIEVGPDFKNEIINRIAGAVCAKLDAKRKERNAKLLNALVLVLVSFVAGVGTAPALRRFFRP